MEIKRNHNLQVGEVVYDNGVQYFGVIVELGDDYAKLDMNGKSNVENLPCGWCEMENKLMFDEELNEENLVWETNNLDELYQVAWGIKDNRTDNIVCYEHMMFEDAYPYYSPYLNENLFNFEVNEC